jgi:hypothetical protein
MNTELIINKLENFITDKDYLLLVNNWLNQLAKYNPRDPIVEFFEETVTITWNRGHYYFNNEILLNGHIDWFFRNRYTNEVAEGLESINDNFHSSEFQRVTKIATE